jgi:hypothetical protein
MGGFPRTFWSGIKRKPPDLGRTTTVFRDRFTAAHLLPYLYALEPARVGVRRREAAAVTRRSGDDENVVALHE